MPNLNSIDKESDPTRRQFLIDDQLGCLTDAVDKLIELEATNKAAGLLSVVEYVTKHSLYHHVVKQVKVTGQMRCSICLVWAEKMERENHNLQAAILYRQAAQLEESERLFFNRNRWKLGAACQGQVQKYAEGENTMSHADGGAMAWALLKQPEEAVQKFVAGNCWEDAYMVANLAKRPDLIQTEITPGIKLQAETVTTRLNTAITEWTERLDRIMELRTEQQKKIELIRDGYDDDQVC